MSTPISADSLANFRNSVLDLAKTELPNLDSDVFYQLEYILQDNIPESELELDNYVDEYDEDWTREEDIVNTLQDHIPDIADIVREQDEFIHESVDSSSTIIYTSEYQDFYFENTEECVEAFESSWSMSDCRDIDHAIQTAVCLALYNALREDFETLAEWLEDLDVVDAL